MTNRIIPHPRKLRPKRQPTPQKLVEHTWNKAWAKTWVLENSSFRTPASLISGASFQILGGWLETMPEGRWVVVKPHTCSLSRGVRIVSRRDGGFQNADLKRYNLQELLVEIASDLPRIQTAFKWLVEEYICPPPKLLADLRPDGMFNPLVRNIMVGGQFNYGELHIPTIASKGRGTLRGGARRVCFNWLGELQETMPPIDGEPTWNAENYGVGKPLAGLVLPNYEDIRTRFETEIVPKLCPTGMFAIDGCYTSEGEFVIIEIEARPNAKHIIPFKALRKPE